jgi:GxxExxY protein
MQINEITKNVIGAAIAVHKELGPGLLESAYEACLHYELSNKGLYIQRQLGLPLTYQELNLEVGYRLDLLVESQVVVEVKCVECFTDVHIAQLLTYMKLSKAPLGLLINFNVMKLVNGIKRVIARNTSAALCGYSVVLCGLNCI